MLRVYGGFYLFCRKVVGFQAVGIDPYPYLPVPETRKLDASDAFYRLQAFGHYLVNVPRKRFHVRPAVVFDRNVHYRPVCRVVFVDLRGLSVIRKSACSHAHLSAHVSRRIVDVPVQVELYDDHGASLITA